MRRRVTLGVLVAVGVAVGLTFGAVAGGASRSRALSGSSTSPWVVGSGRLPAPRDGSFLSLWPACGCSNKLVLGQFSLANGRRLGIVAHVSRSPVTVSVPHVGPDGEVWLTFSSGPRYRSDVAGGDPAPNSCSGRALRFDPRTQRTTIALTFPSSQLVADVIPSPSGRRVVTVSGGCATSFFNQHFVVRELRTGKHWSIGADAVPCHALSNASWSPNGSRLVFAYGPSTLPAHTRFNPSGCPAPRPSRLAVVPAGRTTPVASWKLIMPDKGCSYAATAFDRTGIAAIESCTRGRLAGRPSGSTLGNAYLVQLGHNWRIDLRRKLGRGYDGGDITTDPRTGTVLVSEYQGANQGIPVFNWVWAFNGHTLRTIKRFPNKDAPTVIAEPW